MDSAGTFPGGISIFRSGTFQHITFPCQRNGGNLLLQSFFYSRPETEMQLKLLFSGLVSFKRH